MKGVGGVLLALCVLVACSAFLSATCPNELEGNDIPQLADGVGTLPGSGCISGSIGTVGDLDYYWFDVTAPQWVSIETVTDEDTEIVLFDDFGAVIASNDDVGARDLSSALLEYLNVGTYYVLVHEHGDDNVIYSYTLSISSQGCAEEAESNDNVALSDYVGAVPGSVCAVGAIGVYGDVDFYRFDVDVYSVVTLYTASDGDTEIALLDGYGVIVAQNDDGPSGGLTSLLSVDLPAGMYFVKVWEHNNDERIAQYILYISSDICTSEVEPNDDMFLADALGTLPGELCASGSIGMVGDVDVYGFVVSTASYVTLTTVTDGDSELALLDVYGNVLAYNDDVSLGDFSSWIGQTLNPGTYYVIVLEHDSDDVIPTYSLLISGR